MICIKDKLLCIELKVTHGCDEEKINKVKKLDIDMIEIDLSDFSEVDLEEFVLYKAQRKWIHKTKIAHKEEEIFKNIIYDKNNKKIEILKDFCPNCGEIYSTEDFENIFLINTIGMDRDCIKCYITIDVKQNINKNRISDLNHI